MCAFFFFNDTATTEIYTLSLHDALPILVEIVAVEVVEAMPLRARPHVDVDVPVVNIYMGPSAQRQDRKSTRLNSSHLVISYAVFCLKKKKKKHASSRSRTRQTETAPHNA